MKARIFVTLKNGVLDPQSQTIQGALAALGFSGIDDVRQGKVFDVSMDLPPESDDPEQLLSEMAEKLLANMVIEDYRVEILSEK